MRRTLFVVVVAVIAAMSAAMPVDAGLLIGTITVDPTSGPPGTSVTVTADNCGEVVPVSETGAVFLPGTGQLFVYVDQWPDPFNSKEGFAGGTNDAAGIVTATFQVPEVDPGTYEVSAECRDACISTSGGDVEGEISCSPTSTLEFGGYPSGEFTVTEPAVTPPAATPADAVAAQATTAG